MSTGLIVELVLAAVLLVLLVLVLLVLRRLQQLRRGGVDVAIRRMPERADDARGWHSGIGRYRGDQFRWYRISGLRSAPDVVLDRTEVEVVDRRPARGPELGGRTSTMTVLRCRGRAGVWEVAMAPDVLTGFSSWLESTPPGRSTGYRQAAG